MTKLASALLGIGMLFVAHALPAQTLFESLQRLPPLQNARVINASQQEAVEKIYPLGSVRRISGRLRYTGEVLLHGQQSVLTVQLAPTHTAGDAFMAARDYLEQHDAQMLFWCEGKDCGPSSLWANAVFDTARLYGPDDRQAYALFRLGGDEQATLVALYAITRGNGRGFLHAEYFQSEQLPADLLPTAPTLERQLSSDERLHLPHLTDLPDPVWTKILVRALNRNSTMRISMAGEHAQEWYDAMVEQGLRASRVELEAEYSKPGLLLQRLP